VKKMPLGKLTKQQIARGFEALEALEEAMKNPTGDGQSLEELSSCFYTVIPHNFGRSRPPPINSPDVLQAKKDMLLVRAGQPREYQAAWAKRRGAHGHVVQRDRLRAKRGESWTERWGGDGIGSGVSVTWEGLGQKWKPTGQTRSSARYLRC
jgi:hypothetical protein